MRKQAVRTAILSAAHFFVDFACAYLLLRRFRGTPEWMQVLLVYNFCAFALQLPFGILADAFGRPQRFAALGCAAVAGAYALPGALPAAVLAGIGNSLFHVGGGCEVLGFSGDRAAALGAFVSPGAIGLYLGMLLGSGGDLPLWPAALLLLLLAVALLRGACLEKATVHAPGAAFPPWLAGAALTIVVVLRSWCGFLQTFSWKQGLLAFLCVCATAFGKAAGGFASDRIGMARTGAVSLAGSAVLFLASFWAPAGLAAVLLFNLTMPLTLSALARSWPGHGGAAFGLLTFALFLGFLPGFFGLQLPGENRLWLTAFAAVSLALLLPAVAGRPKRG